MYKEEVALRFGYPYERIDEAKKLEKLLDSKGIKFLFYESNGYWKHEFVIRRSAGYTWNEIMGLINSVYAPSNYKKEKTWFNNDEGEIVFCN